MTAGKALRAGIAGFCVMCLFTFVSVGLVHAVSQQTITGTVSSVQGYTIFLQGNEQGFYLAATSTLGQGISLSNLNALVGLSVTITYRTVNDKNGILTIVVNSSP